MVKCQSRGRSVSVAAVKQFLVTDLDNTLVDSRERFNRSISEATDSASPITDTSALDLRKLSPQRRNRFYEVFLSGKYMHLDVPVRGSVEVVSRLRRMKGLGTIYLTGRHHSKEDSLKTETLKSLSRLGFPLPNARDVFLCMKPKRMMSTSRYKRSALQQLTKSLQLAVGVDDEPDDLQVMSDSVPLTIGLALSPDISRQITSRIRVPIAKDWYEVESIILANHVAE